MYQCTLFKTEMTINWYAYMKFTFVKLSTKIPNSITKFILHKLSLYSELYTFHLRASYRIVFTSGLPFPRGLSKILVFCLFIDAILLGQYASSGFTFVLNQWAGSSGLYHRHVYGCCLSYYNPCQFVNLFICNYS